MINQVNLLGHLGKDPECQTTGNDSRLARFSLATSSKFGGEDKTEWHNITCWGKNADYAEKYLRKGSLIFVEGRIEYQSWTDKETGQTKYMTKIIAHRITGVKRAEGTNEDRKESHGSAKADDDDIPF